ncbi:hypothetical protein D7Y13_27185 [Corallococcus praedator]|uniref:Uncharacterized protein n=1 Tax=Corallococcus praedator TaxID=2316724 RepID=A0ABX9QEF0_9BACT|nr:hypothetical protein D7X75_06965 [Corallococcus sp. CA031C]RKH99894.1 hypothetical protein D7Y13_27185 [Corallococcus praedator]
MARVAGAGPHLPGRPDPAARPPGPRGRRLGRRPRRPRRCPASRRRRPEQRRPPSVRPLQLPRGHAGLAVLPGPLRRG